MENATEPCGSQSWGGSSRSLAVLAVLTGGNDLTWRSPRLLPELGRAVGSRDLALVIYRFLQCLAGSRQLGWSHRTRVGMGMLLTWCQEELSWLFTPSSALSGETKDLERPEAAPAVKPAPCSRIQQEMGGGPGVVKTHSKANSQMVCSPVPLIPAILFSSFSLWMYEMDVAPPLWHSCLARWPRASPWQMARGY